MAMLPYTLTGYHKNSKIWDIGNIYHNCPQIKNMVSQYINGSERCVFSITFFFARSKPQLFERKMIPGKFNFVVILDNAKRLT